MGINTLFNIAESAINTQRLAIEVTSQNIANVNTPGYSRQRAIMETAPTVNSGGFPMASGVKMAEVQRSYDVLLQRQIVDGNSTSGKDSSLLTYLQQVEPTFNELTSNGLGQAMEDFFNSWHDLSVNPQGAPERQAVLARANVLVDTFHQMNTNLTNVVESADNALTGITQDITKIARDIASLNVQIKTTKQLGGNPNELQDARDYQIQLLAEKVGITVSPEDADGMVTVSLSGVAAGNDLVSGVQYRNLYTYNNGTDNDIYLTALGNPPPAETKFPTAPIGTDVTDQIGGPDNSVGEIGGTLQIRDTIVGGDDGYLSRLNEMARQLAERVNTIHTQGYDLSNPQVLGIDFFAKDPAADPAITSKNITLNISGPNDIAAAYQDVPATSIAPGNNINARRLADLKGTTVGFVVDGITTNATFSGYYDSFVSNVGIDVQKAQSASNQDTAFLKQLNALRESNAGVSLDEELTNLVKYQRAFEAAAKTVNAATDLMDIVIGLVR